MESLNFRECLDSILAVVVLYRRELPGTETFTSLSRSLEAIDGSLDLFVYDNSPEASPLPDEPRWRIHYRHDPGNSGVSAAYNRGCQKARELGKQWLLLLDQDTVFPVGSLAEYCRGVARHPKLYLFAPLLRAQGQICSPCRYFFRTGFHLSRIEPGVQHLRGRAVLNSGMLVRTDAFERVGGFDENIRLDFADFVFNNRLRRHFDSFCLIPLECSHGFSGSSRTELDVALERFQFYCQGARFAIETGVDAVLYSLVVFKRCIRLSLQFHSLGFLQHCLQYFLHK